MDEGKYGILDSTKIIVEELRRLKPAQRFCPPLTKVYGSSASQFMDIGRVAVMERAAEILRKRAGWSRAEAVEMAYDNLLNSAPYERVGEVILLKSEGVARALCIRKEES